MGLTERELYTDSRADAFAWFALTVRHQHERQIQHLLAVKGLETLAPLYRTRRTWSDRIKEIELPLFAGYVLCRFRVSERVRVLNTPGVTRIVGFGGEPATVSDHEIEEIRTVAASGLPVRPWPFLRAGDRVRVERGPLRGLEGTLLHENDSMRLIVSVSLLQRSIAVELDPDTISPVRQWPLRAESASGPARRAV